MPVCRGKSCLTSVELDIDPGEHRATLVAGCGNHGLLDRILQLRLVDLDLPAFDPRRHGREIRRIDAPNIGIEPVALDRQ